MYKRIHYIILLLVIPQLVSASALDSLWNEYHKNPGVEKKIGALLSIYQLNVDKADINVADSTIAIAIDILQLSDKDSISVEVYKKYFSKDVDNKIKQAIDNPLANK